MIIKKIINFSAVAFISIVIGNAYAADTIIAGEITNNTGNGADMYMSFNSNDYIYIQINGGLPPAGGVPNFTKISYSVDVSKIISSVTIYLNGRIDDPHGPDYCTFTIKPGGTSWTLQNTDPTQCTQTINADGSVDLQIQHGTSYSR